MPLCGQWQSGMKFWLTAKCMARWRCFDQALSPAQQRNPERHLKFLFMTAPCSFPKFFSLSARAAMKVNFRLSYAAVA